MKKVISGEKIKQEKIELCIMTAISAYDEIETGLLDDGFTGEIISIDD